MHRARGGAESVRCLTDATFSAMYQDALLAHYRAPHNRRTLDHPTAAGTRKNPLCGDAITVQVQLEGNHIIDVAFTGRGCSIAVASASMLTDVVRGLAAADARGVANRLDALLAGAPAPDLPAALDALRGVAPFPGRHGCATMPWAALRSALGH